MKGTIWTGRRHMRLGIGIGCCTRFRIVSDYGDFVTDTPQEQASTSEFCTHCPSRFPSAGIMLY